MGLTFKPATPWAPPANPFGPVGETLPAGPSGNPAIGTDPNLYGTHDKTQSRGTDPMAEVMRQVFAQNAHDSAARTQLQRDVLIPKHETNLLGPAAFHSTGGANDVFQARPGTPEFNGPNPWTGPSLAAKPGPGSGATAPMHAPDLTPSAPPASGPIGAWATGLTNSNLQGAAPLDTQPQNQNPSYTTPSPSIFGPGTPLGPKPSIPSGTLAQPPLPRNVPPPVTASPRPGFSFGA